MPELNIREGDERRKTDLTLFTMIDRYDVLVQDVRSLKSQVTDLNKQVLEMSYHAKNATKDLEDHENLIKSFNVFMVEMKSIHKLFEEHIATQKKTNETFGESTRKIAEMQNKMLMVLGAVVVVWQMFGAKVFDAVGVLIK